jgi:hypothetical protein
MERQLIFAAGSVITALGSSSLDLSVVLIQHQFAFGPAGKTKASGCTYLQHESYC